MSPSLVAAKLALGPVLLPQAKWVQRTARRLPEPAGPREGVEGEGDVGFRLLVVGDSSAAGVGVEDQAQALALPMANKVAQRLGRAVQWQLVAQSGVNTRDAMELVRRIPVRSADVAVVVLGVNDVTSQVAPAEFTMQLRHLVALLPAERFVFCGLPPMHLFSALPQPLRWYLGRCARTLDGELREWCTAHGHRYVAGSGSSDARLLAEDGYHPGPMLYREWAAHLAQVVAP